MSLSDYATLWLTWVPGFEKEEECMRLKKTRNLWLGFGATMLKECNARAVDYFIEPGAFYFTHSALYPLDDITGGNVIVKLSF